MLKPPISPYVVTGRIIAIIGLSFFSAAAILLFIGGLISWGVFSIIAILPFLFMIVAIEKYSTAKGWIGPEVDNSEED